MLSMTWVSYFSSKSCLIYCPLRFQWSFSIVFTMMPGQMVKGKVCQVIAAADNVGKYNLTPQNYGIAKILNGPTVQSHPSAIAFVRTCTHACLWPACHSDHAELCLTAKECDNVFCSAKQACKCVGWNASSFIGLFWGFFWHGLGSLTGDTGTLKVDK